MKCDGKLSKLFGTLMSESRSMRQAASVVDRARCCAHNTQYVVQIADYYGMRRDETQHNALLTPSVKPEIKTIIYYNGGRIGIHRLVDILRGAKGRDVRG